MMYRVFLFLAFVAYCSSAPFASSNIQKSVTAEEDDMSDVIDTNGSGYSYFRKQNIDTDSSVQSSLDDIPAHDLSIYMQASALDERPSRKQSYTPVANQLLNSAYGSQQQTSRSNLPLRKQRPKLIQQDLARLSSASTAQSEFPGANIFGNQRPSDLRRFGSKQFAFPQPNGNIQQQLFNNFDPYQSHNAWSAQQKSAGFNSFYGGPGQVPASSSFFIQSQQQNDQPPISNALFLSSQRPSQRFTSSKQAFPNKLWE